MEPLLFESKALLRTKLREAVGRAQAAGRLPELAVEEIEIEAPKDRTHGDLATNLALVLAKAAKMPPKKVAEVIVAELAPAEPVSRVETAGPGFINFFLSPSWREEAIRRAIAQGADYGRTTILTGRRIQVEFVSANPVGPL
ncbi:MAG: arginine--tRNA ligase, partial [Firmicutes bacterium]|nr:arginine--tRNA ligase [Bacillota bacterium]